MTVDTPSIQNTDIAIVGMAGQFPGACDVDVFWENLINGIESIVTYSKEELLKRGVPEKDLNDPEFVQAGASLPDIDKFDAAFFSYSPREAEEMDPQHRIFLETAWKALEHAGYNAEAWPQPIGVYGGVGVNTYLLLHLMPSGRFSDFRDISSLQGLMNGNNKDSMTTTVSYKLNLKGPAITVQTACSTSLTAVHVACRSLLNHEVDMALAGGVWLNLLHENGYRFQSGAILSPDGHCRAFDARAEGTVIGSGVGLVVLKRMKDALLDGDTIHAVIKGSALNNDGSTKIGYTAPSVEGQAEVIISALAMAGVPAETVTYVEAHGTGTTMGDPIEVAALTQAFRATTNKLGYCAIGSVKTNVGHLDAAAGVTGLIKTVQALRHGILPPSLHFETPNPQIDFESSPFYVNTKASDWPKVSAPRRAGVSSFGIGGTNVHVILEEAPIQSSSPSSRDWQLLPLSARTTSALDTMIDNLCEHLRTHKEQSIADVAYTLQTGRKNFSHRAMAAVRDQKDAVSTLEHRSTQYFSINNNSIADSVSVAFLFPGQGAQHVGMASYLYNTEPVFRAEFDRCSEGMKEYIGVDLRSVVYPANDKVEEASKLLIQTSITQPALFAIEFAMARMWMSWGIEPKVMIGHSIGEYVAACLAGVFSFGDALRLVALRGKLMQALPLGAMLMVNLSEEDIAPYVDKGCDLAAVNGPEHCVLSGSVDAIHLVEGRLKKIGVAIQSLQVSHAFHSSMVESACQELEELVSSIARQAPSIPFLSNVTGHWITAQEAVDPGYWARHLRGTVRFSDGVIELLREPGRVLLEVGPGDTLSKLVKRHSSISDTAMVVSSLPHPQSHGTTGDYFTMVLGRLWIVGVDIDWEGLHINESRLRVPLPTYPFERKTFWISAPDLGSRNGSNIQNNTGMTKKIDDWFYTPSWERVDEQQSGLILPIGCTLIFGDAGELRDAMVKHVQSLGSGNVIVIEVANHLERLGINLFGVRAGNSDDFDEMLSVVYEEFGVIVRVFHLWNLTSVDEQMPFLEIQERGFFSLIALARGFDIVQSNKPVSITIVANLLEDVIGQERIDPAQATLLGPCKVIPQEYPYMSCRIVDIEEEVAMEKITSLVGEAGSSDKSTIIAYRGSHRWLQNFMPVLRPAPTASPLRQRGVYLITGGLGGIGLVLAQHLARTVEARLVLVSRSEPGSVQQEAISLLHKLGGDVLVIQADITQANQVENILEKSKSYFGAIDGVIHAAGDGRGGLIADITAEFVEEVFSAKIQGTQVLMAALADEPIDFMVLCSSLSTIAGGLSKVGYCAANAFLDGVARAAVRQSAFPVISVNWDSWRDVGMAAGMVMPEGVGIDPSDGVLAFDRILAGMFLPQVIISTLELEMRLDNTRSDLLAQPLAVEVAVRGTGHTRPDLTTTFEAPQDELQEGIAEIWRSMLGITEIGIQDNLFELGGDSLLGIQILSKVRLKYAIELPPAALFKHPTISELARLVEKLLIDEIESNATVVPS